MVRDRGQASSSTGAPARPRPWYTTAFGRDYLARYAHRTDSDARAEVRFLSRLLGPAPGKLVLDLCCGAGRHSRALARAGYRVVGVDLSAPLLHEAHRAAIPRLQLCLRADARRLPLRDGVFDGAVNLFTSFGYFEREEEDLEVLCAVCGALKPGGLFVLDFFNLAPTVSRLVPRTESRLKDACVVEERRYDPRRRRLEKTIRCEESRGLSAPLELLESVRAYSPEELAAMLRRAGLATAERFGDLRGSPFDARNSPRCVLVGRKDPV